MRGRLAIRESLKAFVRGRVVSKGAGFWVLTSDAILVFGEAPYPYRMPFSQVESITGEEGQYGLTLRLRVKGASYAEGLASGAFQGIVKGKLAGRHLTPHAAGDRHGPGRLPLGLRHLCRNRDVSLAP